MLVVCVYLTISIYSLLYCLTILYLVLSIVIYLFVRMFVCYSMSKHCYVILHFFVVHGICHYYAYLLDLKFYCYCYSHHHHMIIISLHVMLCLQWTYEKSHRWFGNSNRSNEHCGLWGLEPSRTWWSTLRTASATAGLQVYDCHYNYYYNYYSY